MECPDGGGVPGLHKAGHMRPEHRFLFEGLGQACGDGIGSEDEDVQFLMAMACHVPLDPEEDVALEQDQERDRREGERDDQAREVGFVLEGKGEYGGTEGSDADSPADAGDFVHKRTGLRPDEERMGAKDEKDE